MNKLSFFLIDEDADEYLIFQQALQGVPYSANVRYYATPYEIIAELTAGLIAAPDFIILGVALPSWETTRVLNSFKAALAGSSTKILLYGMYDDWLFRSFVETHQCQFLQKYDSLHMLQSALTSLMDQYVNSPDIVKQTFPIGLEGSSSNTLSGEQPLM